MDNAMTMLLPDESPSQHELSRTAKSFTYSYGKVGKDSTDKKTWHLATVSGRPLMTLGPPTIAVRQETHSKFSFSKTKEKIADSLRYQSYPPLGNTSGDCSYKAVDEQRDCPKSLSRVSVQGTGHKFKYTSQRKDSVCKLKTFSSISEKNAKFPSARKYRDYYLNQNSEGNSDTSESEVGAGTLDALNPPALAVGGVQRGVTVFHSPSNGHNHRVHVRDHIGRKPVDIFTVNADANQSQRPVSNKSPRCKPLSKRKSDSGVSRGYTCRDTIREYKTTAGYLELLRVGDKKTTLVENSKEFPQYQTSYKDSQLNERIRKRKRLQKIYVDGLWIPVRSKKDIRQLFSTEPVVILDRIPASVLRRLATRGHQRVATIISNLDTTETRKEMDDDIDELKQNIADNNVGGCAEYPMDLTNYSLGAPDKLFEVDPSITFNIDNFRKACSAFSSPRETSTGPDPVISGYRPEEEERLRSDEPEYVYFDEPAEVDEVFRDSYDMNAFSESSKFLELQDTDLKDEVSSAKDISSKSSLRVPGISDDVKNEGQVKLEDAAKTPRKNIFEANKFSDSACDSKLDPKGTGFQDPELLSKLDIDDRLSNIFYRNRDSTDPGEPYSPEYIDHTLQKSPTPPLLENCSLEQISEGEIPQSPPSIDTSFLFEPVSPLRDDQDQSPAQKIVPVDTKPATKCASPLSLNVSSSSRIVSSTPVTAAGETIIIEEIRSPENAVLVSDSVQISEMEPDTPIPLRLDGKKNAQSNSTCTRSEKGALDSETVIELTVPRSDRDTILQEATMDQNVASYDNQKDVAKTKGLDKKEHVSTSVCDDFEMDIERDEPYPVSMVVVNLQECADRITQSVVLKNSCDGLEEQATAHEEDQQYGKVYDLSTTTVRKDDFEIGDSASSLTGTTVFGESFPYGFGITSSGASQPEPNNLISSAELDAIERMTNGNLSDDEVFPRLVINEDNSNLGSSANESDLVIENVISLKNVTGNYLGQNYQFDDFNMVTEGNENTDREQPLKGQNFISEPDNDRALESKNDSQVMEVAEGSLNLSVEALDMTSSLGKTINHVPRGSSPESTKSEGSLKCVLTKKMDSGAQVRYVIKSLSSVDSDDPAPFFTLSRDERGEPRSPYGAYSPDNARENEENDTNTNGVGVSYVTREQAILTCTALAADIPTPAYASEYARALPQQRGDMQSERNSDRIKPKSYKKSKTKKSRDLKRPVGKNRPNLGVVQKKFIKRPLIRRSRISSTLKQFNTRSKSHKLKISSPEQKLINSQHVSKKTEKVHVKRTWRPSKQDIASEMSSDLSDLGELVEQAILDGHPIKKRKPRRKKEKCRNKLEAKDAKDGKGSEEQKRDTSTEGDDLPEILPPKRRRVRPPQPTAQLIEESEVISRLSREFPKHNWLVNKIKLFDQNQEEGHKMAPAESRDLVQLAEDFNSVGDESAPAASPDLSQSKTPSFELAVIDENKGSVSVQHSKEVAQQIGETAIRSEAKDLSKTADSAEQHVDLSDATESDRHASNLTNVDKLVQRVGDTNSNVECDQIRGDSVLEQQQHQEPRSEPGTCSHVVEVTHGPRDVMKPETPVSMNFPKGATISSVRLASIGNPKRPGELSMKDTLDGMIEARLLNDVREEGQVVDLTVPQSSGSAPGKEPAQASPQQEANDADRTGNYWSGSATKFNIRGPQQRTTKHSTPVQRVQPQIKSNHEQPEAARTQAEVVTSIKMQISKMEESSASAAGQRSFPGRDSDKAANTGPITSNMVTTSSTVSAAAGGPVSVVPPIQTLQPRSVPDPHVYTRPAVAIPQAMGVHRSAQMLYQQAQSVGMNQTHVAQISHPSQINNPLRICPQHRPIMPRQPVPTYHQQRSAIVSRPPAPHNQTPTINSHQNNIIRLEIPIPKTPITPVTDSPFPIVSSAESPLQTPTVTTPNSPHTSVASAVDRQGKSVRPMTPGTFVREYQKMKREFQRIEAMLTIKERERKQLLFMKSRMSLLIDKMENKLRSLPMNYSSKLFPLLPRVNVEQTTTPKTTNTETVAQPGSDSTSGPPPAHVKEPFTPTVPRTDLRAAHSNKTSTVPRHLIFMENEMKSNDQSAVIAGDKVPQPAHAHPRVTADANLAHRSECKRKEDDCHHPSAWKRYAVNIGQEGCAIHSNPLKEQDLQTQGKVSQAKRNVEIIDLTTETPLENGENQSRSYNVTTADVPAKVSPENDKEQRVQELLHDVQTKRVTGNVVVPHHTHNRSQYNAPPALVAPGLYSPNSGGPPALVPLNATPSSAVGSGQQHSDPRAAHVQRPVESSRSTAVHDSGRPIYSSGNTQPPAARPQYTSGNDISPGLPRLSGYNPPYANHTIGEPIRVGNPMDQSPGPPTSSAPNTYFHSKPAATTNRPPDGYSRPPGPPNTSMYGHTNMTGPLAANGVSSSPNLPTDRPSSIPRSTPPVNAVDRSRAFYSMTGPSPTTLTNTAPVASPLRQNSNCPSASPHRDPTRRPSFPGTAGQIIDIAPPNIVPVANIQDTEMDSNKPKSKKKAPKRGMSLQMPQPHPMAMQQYYRGQSPMMTMDPRTQISMQAPRLLGPDRRSPHEIYMAQQAEMMPGMIQMSPRAQMMHQVRHPSPNKQVMGYGEQPPGHPMMQDTPSSHRHRDFATQHQRMMQSSMGMMPPQQTVPRMAIPGTMPPRQTMMMPPPPMQLPQYNPMQMPSVMAMEASRGGRELPHSMVSREVPHPMGGPPAGLYQADSLCGVCNQRAAFLCSGCKRMWYCSERCQAKSWNERHRMECPAVVL